ncbi:hypothetical protein [Pseudoruegeria sp. HB172150]|uniref:hypothetical protein n=1 Tax=Pseudoruegeria sp. HB172150 TaxID=2721164 RepID=UPI00155309DC|nr:hypothetical protein [Pseudoruegeria sp. HB172150]
MTEDIGALPLKNQKHEQFARLIAVDGMGIGLAYATIQGRVPPDGEALSGSIRASAGALAKKHATRIEFLREEQARLALAAEDENPPPEIRGDDIGALLDRITRDLMQSCDVATATGHRKIAQQLSRVALKHVGRVGRARRKGAVSYGDKLVDPAFKKQVFDAIMMPTCTCGEAANDE